MDIAVRALSPGVNDPTTAVHALSHVSALLGELATHSLQSGMVQDQHGCLRLVLPQWTVPDLVQLALEEPVHFAEGQPAVLRRLARLLQELAWRAPRGTLDGLVPVYLEQVVRSAEDSTQIDTAEIALWRRDVAAAFAGAWGSRG